MNTSYIMFSYNVVLTNEPISQTLYSIIIIILNVLQHVTTINIVIRHIFQSKNY